MTNQHVALIALLAGMTIACTDDPPPRRAQLGQPPGLGGSAGAAPDGGMGGAEQPPTESACHDGIDNDGDGAIDCVDTDCTATCGDGCVAPVVISDPGDFRGATVGHAVLGGTSCTDAGGGPAHVFQVVVTHSGTLDAYVATVDDDDDFTVSVRASCRDSSSERICADDIVGHEPPGQEHARADVVAGETVYLIVQGKTMDDAGAYTLTVASRSPVCGDARVDLEEECDDGNNVDGDGCDANCSFVATETEPNDVPAEGDAYVAPWFGRITPPRNADFLTLSAPEERYGYLINIFDLGDGSCAAAKVDSHLAIFDDVMTNIAYDDDSGDGLCSRLIVRDLQSGTHHLAVTGAAKAGQDHEFIYHLAVEGDACGNNTVAGPEQCDDGNLVSGDGCSEYCTVE